MIRTALTGMTFATLGFAAMMAPALAEPPRGDKADTQFLGVDLDTGRTYYDGRNDGRYCLYRTVRVFNINTGYFELRRLRRCGRGLYF